MSASRWRRGTVASCLAALLLAGVPPDPAGASPTAAAPDASQRPSSVRPPAAPVAPHSTRAPATGTIHHPALVPGAVGSHLPVRLEFPAPANPPVPLLRESDAPPVDGPFSTTIRNPDGTFTSKLFTRPVLLQDPVDIGTHVDTYVATGRAGAANSFSKELQIGLGRDAGGEYTAATYLRLADLHATIPTGSRILDAELFLKEVWAGPGPWNSPGGSCDVRGVGIYRVTEDWDATMSAYPGAAYDPDHKDWAPYAMGGGDACPPGYAIYGEARGTGSNLRSWVQSWSDDPATNFGLTVRVDPGSETDPVAYKVFKSAEHGDEAPFLSVTWSPYDAEYLIAPGTAFSAPVGPASTGAVDITVVNRGAYPWPAEGDYRLAYHVYTESGELYEFNGARTLLPRAVAPGEQITLSAQIAPLPVGTYIIRFDMLHEGATWFSDEAVPPSPGLGPFQVTNLAPRITGSNPLDFDAVATNTPVLSVTAVDPDSSIEYLFRICTGSDAESGTCHDSPWLPEGSWQVPAGLLTWRATWTWHAYVRDGSNLVKPDWVSHLVTHVPQPATEQHFGADAYSPAEGGVNASIGNFVFANRDVAVGGSGPSIDVIRTYNSLDTRNNLFGVGWTSAFDVRATSEGGGELVLVTFADGRQERFGRDPDGTYVPALGSTGRLRSIGDQLQLSEPGGVIYSFNADGKLTGITDPSGRRASLIYDIASGRLEAAVNNAGRKLIFTTTPDGHVTRVATDPVGGLGGVPVVWEYAYTGFEQVSTGGNHACAVDRAGQVWCWGLNNYGQLGNGTTVDSSLPVLVPGIASATAVAVSGNGSSCAVVSGAAMCWGDNSSGQLGNGVMGGSSTTPVQVAGLIAGVTDIALGPASYHACAIVQGAARCWGRNVHGQLGDGTTTDSPSPVEVQGLTSGVTDISVGQATCAVHDGAAMCWGYGSSGQLGNGDTSINWKVPVQVTGLGSGVSAISVGMSHACAVQSGAAKCWGIRWDGELGDGSGGTGPFSGLSAEPVQVQGLTAGVVDIAAGSGSCAVLTGGALRCWGRNQRGELGNGTLSANSTVPVAVSIAGATQVSAGYENVCATAEGSVRCWGANSHGVLGDGAEPDHFMPGDVNFGSITEPNRLLSACRTSPEPTRCTIYTTPPGPGFDRLTTITLPRGNTVRVGYLFDGSVATRTDGTGATWTYAAYDAGKERRVTATDPAGHTVLTTYDDHRRLTSRQDEGFGNTSYAYNDAGFLSRVTDPLSHSEVFGTDERGNVIQRTTSRSATESYSSYFTYFLGEEGDQRNDKVIESRDPRSTDRNDPRFRTTFDYDALGNLKTQTTPPTADFPHGRSTSWTWSTGVEAALDGGTVPAGLLLEHRTPHATGLGRKTVYDYDAKGDLRRVTDPAGLVTEFTYDALGRPTTSTEISDKFPSGLTTTTAYDASGRKVQVDFPPLANRITGVTHTARASYTYDENANRTSVTVADLTGGDPPRTAAYAYDAADRMVTATDPTGATTEVGYDVLGRQVVAVDQLGAVSTTGWTPTGQIATSVVEATGADSLVSKADASLESPVTGWTAGPNTVIERTTERAYAGAWSLKLTAAGAGPVRADLVPSTTGGFFPVQAGREYSAAAVFRSAAASRPVQVGIDWYGAEGHFLGTSSREPTQSSVDRFLRDTTAAVAPAGAANARVFAEVLEAGPGEVHYVEAVRFAAGPAVREVVVSSTYDAAGRLATRTDALGQTTAFTYFDDNLPATRVALSYLEPAGVSPAVRDVVLWRGRYDPAGQVVEEIGPSDLRRTTSVWDAAGRLASTTTDPGGVGRTTAFAYDADGHVTRTTLTGAGEPGRAEVTRATYDALGRILTSAVATDAGDLVTRFGYDQQGLLTRLTDARGSALGDLAYTTDFAHDAARRLIRILGPQVQVEEGGRPATPARPETKLGYDTFGDATHSVDPLGAVTTTEFNGTGQPVRTTLPAYRRPDGTTLTPTSTSAYDAAGRLVASTDPRGQTTTYGYDNRGRLVRVTDPMVAGPAGPGVWEATYDDADRVTASITPDGATSSVAYDGFGRVRTATVAERHPTPVDLITTYGYNDAADLISVTTPAGGTATATYNGVGEALSTTDPTGATWRAAFDAAGRVVRLTDPLGRAQSFTWDRAGRLTGAADHDPAGQDLRRLSYGYDAVGNRTSVTTPKGWTVALTYDGASQRTSLTEPVSDSPADAITTTFGYDRGGNRTRITDGNGHATATTYNPWSLPDAVIEPATAAHPAAPDRTWRTTYDAGGLPIRLDAPGGVTRNRTFDELGRLTAESGTGAEADTAAKSFGYDLLSRLTTASVPGGAQTFTYNDRGAVLSSAGPMGAAVFTYDADGRMTRRSDASGTAAFTWTPRGELATANDPLVDLPRTYTYDAAGQLRTESFGGGRAARQVVWDPLGRIASDVTQDGAGATIAATTYGYDANDNLTSKDVGPPGVAGAGSNTYAYDRTDRLTTWTDPSGAVTTYAFDKAGNRTRAGGTLFTFDERNRMQSETVADAADPVGASAVTYGWTARGTLATRTITGQAAQVSAFDAFDRLTADLTTTYAYDALDRIATAGAAVMSYAGLEKEPAADGTQRFARSPSGNLLAVGDGTSGLATRSDTHGDITGLYAPAAGAMAGTRAYDPYGRVLASTGADTSVGYQGQWTDPATHRVAMQARVYDPGMGAFTSRDSWTNPPVPSAALNRHAYANANPVTYADPSGHLVDLLKRGIEFIDDFDDYVAGGIRQVEQFLAGAGGRGRGTGGGSRRLRGQRPDRRRPRPSRRRGGHHRRPPGGRPGHSHREPRRPGQ